MDGINDPWKAGTATGAPEGINDPWKASPAPAQAAARPQISQPTGFVDSAVHGFKRALPETKSLLAGSAAAAAGAVGADRVRDAALGYYRDVQANEVEPLANQATFVRSLKGETSLGQWAGDTLGNFAGQAVQSLAAAGAGAALGSVVPGAGTAGGAVTGLVAKPLVRKLVGKEVAKMAAEGAAKKEVGRAVLRRAGMVAAPAALNIGQETGIAYTGRADDAAAAGETLGQGDAFRAIAAGVPAGLLDTAAEGLVATRMMRGSGQSPSMVRRVLVGGAKGAATEGATEGAQAVLERAGAGQRLTGADAYTDYVENVAAGALGGGVPGAASGVRRPRLMVDPITGQTSAVPNPADGPISRAASTAADNGAVPTVDAGDGVAAAAHPPELRNASQAEAGGATPRPRRPDMFDRRLEEERRAKLARAAEAQVDVGTGEVLAPMGDDGRPARTSRWLDDQGFARKPSPDEAKAYLREKLIQTHALENRRADGKAINEAIKADGETLEAAIRNPALKDAWRELSAEAEQAQASADGQLDMNEPFGIPEQFAQDASGDGLAPLQAELDRPKPVEAVQLGGSDARFDLGEVLDGQENAVEGGRLADAMPAGAGDGLSSAAGVPVAGAQAEAVAPANDGFSERYSDFVGNALRKRVMDERGQDMLDEMIEQKVSPADVARKFWRQTYFQMPAEVQQRFTRMLREHTGMEPGSTLAVGPDGQAIVARDWMHIADDGADLPNDAEYLEGTDRGFAVLMHEANTRFGQAGQPSPVEALPNPDIIEGQAARITQSANTRRPQADTGTTPTQSSSDTAQAGTATARQLETTADETAVKVSESAMPPHPAGDSRQAQSGTPQAGAGMAQGPVVGSPGSPGSPASQPQGEPSPSPQSAPAQTGSQPVKDEEGSETGKTGWLDDLRAVVSRIADGERPDLAMQGLDDAAARAVAIQLGRRFSKTAKASNIAANLTSRPQPELRVAARRAVEVMDIRPAGAEVPARNGAQDAGQAVPVAAGSPAATAAAPSRDASPVAAAAAEAATSPKNDHPEPTDAQKEAGNYKKGHVLVGGLDVSIENEAGTSRRPEWPPLKHHYGYIKGSVGADKDHVDVFLTESAEDTGRPVFVVDQYDKGSFDEHKVILGAATEEEARAAYLANYSRDFQQTGADGKVKRGAGAITQMSQDEFKVWVRDQEATKRPAGAPPLSARATAAQAVNAIVARIAGGEAIPEALDGANDATARAVAVQLGHRFSKTAPAAAIAKKLGARPQEDMRSAARRSAEVASMGAKSQPDLPKAAHRATEATRPPAAAAATQDNTASERAPSRSAAAPSAKLDDFGEKLEGARKFLPPTLQEALTDEQIASQPLSKLWPADAHMGIENDVAAALAFAARAEVPAKPRKAPLVARWAEQVKLLRKLPENLENAGSMDALEEWAKRLGLRLDGFFARVRLLSQLPREHWGRVGKVGEHPYARRSRSDAELAELGLTRRQLDEAKPYLGYGLFREGSDTPLSGGQRDEAMFVPDPHSSVQVDGKSHEIPGGKLDQEAVEQVRALLGDAPARKTTLSATDFEVFTYRNRPETFIRRKGDSENRHLKTFASGDGAAQARAFLKDPANLDALAAEWEKVKARDNVGKADTRRDANRARVGESRRNGKDVTEQMFADAFGFRGVQFGNWVGQGRGAKDRQGLLNESYDALLDLADVLGIPSRAISLNGTLGLSLGARGGGKASAHFERDNLVINLTKTRGAGTLAHEWFHGLDNYFSRLRGNATSTAREANFITYKPEPAWVHQRYGAAGSRTSAALRTLLKNRGVWQDGQTLEQNAEDAGWRRDPQHKSGVRPEVEREFAALVEALNASPMAARSATLDKGVDGYWNRIIERGARSFENYVIAKLAQRGWTNDFLANVRDWKQWADLGKNKDRYPYLFPEEEAPIVEAFDSLFGTIQTRETDTGTVALFSRRGWDGAFPDAVLGHQLGVVQAHPDYAAGKSGNTAAALRLSRDLVTDDYVEAIRAALPPGAKPVVVPVLAAEAGGNNRIPQTTAHVLASKLGLKVEDGIVQASKVNRGGADGVSRLGRQPKFEGAVMPGQEYLLLDDTLTQGGTLAQLKTHIEDAGGKVLLVSALTGKDYSRKIALSPETLGRLRDRFGSIENWWRDTFGYGFEGFTESEAAYLLKLRGDPTPESIRDRVVAGGLPEVRGVHRSRAGEQGVARGLAFDQAQTLKQQLTSNWGRNAPRVVLVADSSELASAARGVGVNLSAADVDRVEGMYLGKPTVWLNLSEIRTAERFREVLTHEALGHFGVEQVIGKAEWRSIAEAIDQHVRNGTGAQDLRDAIAQLRRTQPDIFGDPEAVAKEVIAVMAEKGSRNGLVQRVVAAVRRFLRRIMPDQRWTDTEIRALLHRADRFLRAGRSNEQARMAVRAMAFSRNQNGVEFSHAEEALQSRLAQWSAAVRLGQGGPRAVGERSESLGPVDRSEAGAARQGDASREEIRDQSARLIQRAKDEGFFWGDDSPILAALGSLPAGSVNGGAEHQVFVVGEGDNRFVIRATDNGFFGPRSDISPAQYLARLEDYSRTFPSLQTRLIGVSESAEIPGNAVIWTAQPFVRGRKFGSQSALRDAMAAHGWKEDGYNGVPRFKHEATGAVIEDAHTDNVFQDDNGELYPFDVVVEAMPGGADVLFSRAPADSIDAMETAIREVNGEVEGGSAPLERVKQWLKDATPKQLKDRLRSTWLGALTTRHLTQLGSDYFPTMGIYSDYLAEMGADRNQLQQEGEDVAEGARKWAGKNRAEAAKLFELMHDATILGVDPAEEYQPLQYRMSGKMHDVTPKNIREALKVLREVMRGRAGDDKRGMIEEAKSLRAMLKAEPKRKATYPRLVARWNQLSPEAQAHYRSMRDLYAKRHDQTEAALIQRINDLKMEGGEKRKAVLINMIRQQFEAQRLQGVYFPLQRFGKYFVAAERGESSTFLMFESQPELERAVKGLRARGFKVTAQGLKSEGKAKDAPSGTFVAEVIEKLRASGVSDRTQDEIYQMYLHALPDLSMRKHKIHRKSVPGWDPDALRAFAFNMAHGAHQLARLRYAHKLSDTIDVLQGQQDAKRKEEGADTARIVAGDAILEELRKRHEWISNPQDSKLTNLVSSFGFVYYLGLTPAAALVNLTQTPLITYPYLAAKFGGVKAMNALLAASGDAARTVGNIQRTLTDPDELRAHQVLQRMGALDKTQAHNLMGIAEGGLSGHNPAWAKAMEVIGWGFHKTEVINREATGLAAFRLAREAGQSFDEAVKTAAETINETHYDYTNANRARFMQSGTAKVLLMFRQYSLNTTWHLGRMVWNATKGADPEVKRIARRNLTGILGMSALFSGALGLPLASVVMGVLNSIAASAGDDDEPWDAETEFRKFLVDMLGEGPARVLLGGVANEVTGADIAGRVSFSQLWFRDADRELDGRGTYYNLLEQAAGPMGGVLKNALVGKQLMDEGHLMRGVETVLPKALKDGLKSLRYTTEGVNNLRGDAIVPDASVRQLLLQLGGFTPAEVADRYDRNRALKNYEQHVLDRRSRLVDAFALATRTGDGSGRADVMEQIRTFNTKWPEIRITPRTLKMSMRTRARYSAQAESGIVLNRKIAERVREAVGSET